MAVTLFRAPPRGHREAGLTTEAAQRGGGGGGYKGGGSSLSRLTTAGGGHRIHVHRIHVHAYIGSRRAPRDLGSRSGTRRYARTPPT
jgi:hypothetical protein